jgi:hypothetical protein
MTRLHIPNLLSQSYPPTKAMLAGLAILLAVCAVFRYLWGNLVTSR